MLLPVPAALRPPQTRFHLAARDSAARWPWSTAGPADENPRPTKPTAATGTTSRCRRSRFRCVRGPGAGGSTQAATTRRPAHWASLTSAAQRHTHARGRLRPARAPRSPRRSTPKLRGAFGSLDHAPCSSRSSVATTQRWPTAMSHAAGNRARSNRARDGHTGPRERKIQPSTGHSRNGPRNAVPLALACSNRRRASSGAVSARA
jgi:hypothetical protein